MFRTGIDSDPDAGAQPATLALTAGTVALVLLVALWFILPEGR